MLKERREHKRHQIKDLSIRIYSNLTKGCYTVRVKDIGVGGAYIQSPHLLKEGEVISFELLNSYFRPIYMGNAVVSRITREVPQHEKGFGIMFMKNLSQETIENLMSDHA